MWLYLRERAGWRTIAAFNLLTACLFLTHLFGLCAYALTVAIVAWDSVLRDRGAALTARAHRLAFEAAQFVLPVLLWGLSYSGTGTSFQPLSLPTLGGKLFEVVATLSFTGTFIDLAAFAVLCALMFLGWG